MATVKQYAIQIWNTHKTISKKLGADISWGSIDSRANAVTTDIMLAGLMKILVDKGVVTNGELTAAYNAITSADLPQLPIMVIPDPDSGDVPPPDIGV